MNKIKKKSDEEILNEIKEKEDDFYVEQFKKGKRLHFQRLRTYKAEMPELHELETFLGRWMEIYLHVSGQLTEKEIRVYNSLTRARIKKLKALNKDVDFVVEDIDEFQRAIFESKNNHSLEIESNSDKKDSIKGAKFHVGLLYAKGKLQPYGPKHDKEGISWDNITQELGLESSFRNVVSGTLNNDDNDRNFLKDKKWIKKVHRHCIDNQIDMCQEFLDLAEPIITE